MLTNALPNSPSAKRIPVCDSDAVRRRALDRLYKRKAVVDELIESLEDYQTCNSEQRAVCVHFNGALKCS